MKFTKVQGTGNDFVVIDDREQKWQEQSMEVAKRLCNRKLGIGADGIIFVLPSDIADIRMRIINADGSEPEMCGNGLRCFARFVYEQQILTQRTMKVETVAGIREVELHLDQESRVELVEIDMGEPIFERADIPMIGEGRAIEVELATSEQSFRVTAVSMGNPHCIIFGEGVSTEEIMLWGEVIEKCDAFPNKTNVEFVEVINERTLRMRVWERGVGVTLACGTGACASVVAASITGRASREAMVHLDGGDLKIRWEEENNRVYMQGSAEVVFHGEIVL